MNDARKKELEKVYKIKEITNDYIVMESGVVYSTITHYIANGCIYNTNGCMIVQLNKSIDKNMDSAINGKW